MKILVIEGRNKNQNGKKYDLGEIKEVKCGRTYFINTITVNKKEYRPEMFINASCNNNLTVYLNPVIEAKQGYSHSYFDLVEII